MPPSVPIPPQPTGSASAQTLFHSLIDYAGLFPPAKLSMTAAAQNYAKYLVSERSWMLGRFICPVSRLEELRQAAKDLFPRCTSPVPPEGALEVGGWPISAIIDGDLDDQLDTIFAFNHEHQQVGNGLAEIDAVELKPASAAEIDLAFEAIPDTIYPFFEIDPAGPNARGLIIALAGGDVAAKLRTGGIVATAIPSARQIASFLSDCASAEVPFKATAGLHHAIRAEYPLTYEAGCASAAMHGFLNVFAASLFAMTGASQDDLVTVLNEADAATFRFDDAGLAYRGSRIETARIAAARENFARSFGSCSFTEPTDDLLRLGLI